MGWALLGEGPHSPLSLLFHFFFPVALFFFMIGQFCSLHILLSGKRMVVVRQQQWSMLSLLPHLFYQLCPSAL